MGAALEEQSGYVLPREPSETSICRFVQYWRSKCVEGRLPARADIDPQGGAVNMILGATVYSMPPPVVA